MSSSPTASSSIVVCAFYRFVALDDIDSLREKLAEFCSAHAIAGTILLASEGINATVAGDDAAIEGLLRFLGRYPALTDLRARFARVAELPFRRMKVKLRREIVSFGVDDIKPDARTGVRVAPADWNALISDPAVTVIDTRNDYEYRIGSFAGALNPGTEHFQEFRDYVDKHLAERSAQPVAMFCTGGIRCEKASAYLLERGFSEVYQLDGGILAYLETVPREESLWHGDCFVFDGRVAVDHELQPADYEQCAGCRRPLAANDRADPLYEPGIACPACHASLSPSQRAAFAERRRQLALAERRGERHLGAVMPTAPIDIVD